METIDKLYLELAHASKARNFREVQSCQRLMFIVMACEEIGRQQNSSANVERLTKVIHEHAIECIDILK